MCTTCGCSDDASVSIIDPRTGVKISMPRLGAEPPPPSGLNVAKLGALRLSVPRAAEAGATRAAERAPLAALHAQLHATTIRLEQDILAKNDALAARNHERFRARGITALNLMSSPGSGKTTLLERTIRELGGELPISVIEGDQATLNDAERIRATGCAVIQINLGTGCHLEADMLERGVAELAPPDGSLLMIENVGNLVCPALFDLGESARIVILSVTEGEDKPEKYPHMFGAAQLMIVNKIDLLPHLRFDLARCIACARAINPALTVLCLSAYSGEGMAAWYDWLRASRMPTKSAAVEAATI
jgi:hydrogenase nickel incorporation protein HypB